MRIVPISQQDDESGGFKVAFLLHTALTRAGHDSRMVVLAKTARNPSVTPVAWPLLLTKIFWRLLGCVNDAATRAYPRQPRCGWTGSRYPAGTPYTVRRLQPDVVHLHLFDCLLTYRKVAKAAALATGFKPVDGA